MSGFENAQHTEQEKQKHSEQRNKMAWERNQRTSTKLQMIAWLPHWNNEPGTSEQKIKSQTPVQNTACNKVYLPLIDCSRSSIEIEILRSKWD